MSKVLNELAVYDWVPEIKLFVHNLTKSPEQKTNLLSEKVGDVDTLTTPVNDTVVNAINSLNSAVNTVDKRLFVFALAITE
jgi:hypothetical protein